MTRKWLVIEYWAGNREAGSWTGPALVSTYDYRKFYWWLGPQYMTGTVGDDVRILKHYEAFDGSEDVDAVERQYIMDYPEEPTEPAWGLGWIAPDGTFYSCGYMEHASTAARLWIMHNEGICPSQPDRMLEKQGWIKLYHSGSIEGDVSTPAQLDVLRSLLPMAPDEDEREMMQWMIEDAESNLREISAP